MRNGATRYLYAIRPVGKRGPVKFGMSIDPEERVAFYCTWSPVPLEIIFYVPGEHKLERAVQRYCAESHSHHEWFNWSQRVQDVINCAELGDDIEGFLPKDLPDHPDKKSRLRVGAERRRQRLEQGAA